MAARPLATFVAAAFGPDWQESQRVELCRALQEAAAELNAPLVGGDISATTGPTTLAVTGLGTPGPRGAITRSGARSGDAICVTGTLGGSLISHHMEFMPRLDEALELVSLCDVHAMIDLSDGLSTDVLHIADESAVGVRIDAARVPVATDADRMAEESGREPLWHALNDGEDYELLFTVGPAEVEGLEEEGVLGVPVRQVGEVLENENCRVLARPDGTETELSPRGWEHFSANE
jgi:thiamine-monophosphate kinase